MVFGMRTVIAVSRSAVTAANVRLSLLPATARDPRDRWQSLEHQAGEVTRAALPAGSTSEGFAFGVSVEPTLHLVRAFEVVLVGVVTHGVFLASVASWSLGISWNFSGCAFGTSAPSGSAARSFAIARSRSWSAGTPRSAATTVAIGE